MFGDVEDCIVPRRLTDSDLRDWCMAIDRPLERERSFDDGEPLGSQRRDDLQLQRSNLGGVEGSLGGAMRGKCRPDVGCAGHCGHHRERRSRKLSDSQLSG